MEGIALRMARGGSSITVGSPEMSPTAADGHDAPGVESTAAREAGAGASKTDESADTPSGIELREADDRQMWLERWTRFQAEMMQMAKHVHQKI